MANAIPIRVPGTGGSTLEYVLPANMMQFVQSVNAVIDNTAGADTKPVLTVLDSSNEVIADVPQGRSIPAGGAGRATWALGLDDELDVSHAHPIGFYTGLPLGGNPILAATTTKAMEWTFAGVGGGVDLLETVAPSSKSHPTPKVPGLYWMSARIAIFPTAPGAIPAGAAWVPNLSVQPADLPPAQFQGQAWDDKREVPTGLISDNTTVAILDFFHWTVAIPIYIEMLIRKTAGWATDATGLLQVQRIY